MLESDLIGKNLDSINKEILIVNTCAVTNEAEKQAKQFADMLGVTVEQLSEALKRAGV